MATPAKIAGVNWLVIGLGVPIVSTRRSVIAPPERITNDGPFECRSTTEATDRV